jgi:hypothetical protein
LKVLTIVLLLFVNMYEILVVLVCGQESFRERTKINWKDPVKGPVPPEPIFCINNLFLEGTECKYFNFVVYKNLHVFLKIS